MNEDGSWTLAEPKGSAAAAVRIGFLANEYNNTDDENMLAYQSTRAYNEKYTVLRGLYNDKGEIPYDAVFTIYEPNADYHPLKQEELGEKYVETEYKSYDGLEDTISRTTAQLKSSWITGGEGEASLIEQQFQTAVWNKEFENASEAMSYFYGQYLQGQIGPYVQKGKFAASTTGLINESEIQGDLAGATNDVYIVKLEQNKPQRIRMFIWLEGMDIDCEASAASAKFAVNIEFAGANEKNE